MGRQEQATPFSVKLPGAGYPKKGFKPPVGAWMQARADLLGRLVAAQPGIAAILDRELIGKTFSLADRHSQRAWSLLYYALWHSHHVMRLPVGGDIGETLSLAARG